MTMSLAGGNGIVLLANANDNSAMFASLTGFISRLRGWRSFPAAPNAAIRARCRRASRRRWKGSTIFLRGIRWRSPGAAPGFSG